MVRLADVGANDILYELGCGEGSIVIAAALAGAHAVGVDSSPEILSKARANAAAAGVGDRVTFIENDLFNVDLSPATVITLYLLPSYLERLRPKILQLRAGTKVVSHSFDMGDWPPVRIAKFNGRVLYYWVVGSPTASATSTILSGTLEHLLGEGGRGCRSIRDFYLANRSTFVVLDDGSVGFSRNHITLSQFQWARIRDGLLSRLPDDPLLRLTTEPLAPGGGVAGSIAHAIVNALSAEAINAGGDQYFSCTTGFPSDFFDGAKMTLLVGAGGLSDYVINRTAAEYVHLCDFEYAVRRDEWERRLDQFRRRGNVELSVSDEGSAAQRIRQADVVILSDVTLANGILDNLLPACARCSKVVLEGPSAAIHPKVLFESGVHLILTSPMTREIDAVGDDSFRAQLMGERDQAPCVSIRPAGPV
jgi:predicted nicotinamide N-methyase